MHFISINHYSKQQILDLISLGRELKQKQKQGVPHPLLEGRTLGMIFAKSSTRTRVSFEVGMYQLGGQALFLNTNDIQLGRGETVYDTAKVLSRYLDAIMIRTFSHEQVEELAQFADIPVINGLTDLLHPCQALADFMTIQEHFGTLDNLKLAYVGDGNNVCNSLMLASSKLGVNMSVATPEGYQPDSAISDLAAENAKQQGSELLFTNDANQAVKSADIIYTDTWVSMGQEQEKAQRIGVFMPYQVNKELMDKASSDAVFMHCLPCYREMEVSSEVADSNKSIIFTQAENRMHAQKAILHTCINL